SPEREVTFVDRTSTAPTTATIAIPPVGTTPRRVPGISSLLRRRPRQTTATAPGVALTAPITTTPAAAAPAPVVLGDENRIRQVVANILGNARRYTPGDSPIEIAV